MKSSYRNVKVKRKLSLLVQTIRGKNKDTIISAYNHQSIFFILMQFHTTLLVVSILLLHTVPTMASKPHSTVGQTKTPSLPPPNSHRDLTSPSSPEEAPRALQQRTHDGLLPQRLLSSRSRRSWKSLSCWYSTYISPFPPTLHSHTPKIAKLTRTPNANSNTHQSIPQLLGLAREQPPLDWADGGV